MQKLKKEVILQTLKDYVQKYGRIPTRDKFVKVNKGFISRRDIEETFGSYAELLYKAGFKPKKWSKISDSELLEEYKRLVKFTGEFPLTKKTISQNSKYSYSVFKKRFNGLKKLAQRYVQEYKLSLENTSLEITQERNRDKATEERKVPRTFTGFGAEYLVVGQLLNRGFNSNRLAVDEGLDIIATNDSQKLFLIQVKSSHFTLSNQSNHINITQSSYYNNQGSNIFYIFVLWLRGENHETYLIMPQSKIDELIKNGFIVENEPKTKLSFKILLQDSPNERKFYVNSTEELANISSYVNDWSVLK